MRRSDQRQVYQELLAVIRRVRRRWRLRILLRGLSIVGIAALAVAGAALLLLGRLQYAPEAAGAIRIGAAVILAIVALVWLVRPLLRRVPDEQVALYLEEHEPSLEAAVLSALDARDAEAPADGVISDALLRRTLETAIARCHAIEDGRFIEQRGLIRVSAALAGVLLVAGLAGFLVPGSARYGASLLFSPTRDAEAATSFGIEIIPGNATFARGADASVTAQLRGFDTGLVELAVRAAGDSAFERLPMGAGPDGTFGYLLFDLEEDTEYFVEAGGVRSEVFTLTVAELPYVRRLDIELVYPSYTGLPSRTIESGGDVAALRGTVVRLRITPTLPVDGGGIVVGEAAPVPLTPDATGMLTGEFTMRSDGFYHIELAGPGGAAVEASPRYVIDALSDGAPIVSFSEPGRDERATAVDEIYLEARAEDDYGVGSLTLHYSVNGGAEEVVELYGGRESLKEVSAGHTLYLDEFGLQPGDLVSYYATASDTDRVDGRKTATSDIYFVQIRPFSRDYTAAEQQGPPMGGQPQQGEDGDLSRRQRDIIAATFNLIRDSADYAPSDFRENLNTLALAQERLRDDTRTLAQRMVARQVTQDTAFQRIAVLLPAAADEMESAAERLRTLRAGEALPPEQRALQNLQRAEAIFREVQVQMGQQQGQQGGGGPSPNAEDLADLFELEMDKLRNQYETVNRGGQPGAESASPELDETAERLKELARRQQREAERRRREALQGQGTQGGQAQRELAEAAEEEARRLERLSREQNRPELQEAARRLEDAARAMRRSASSAGGAEEASDRLREAQRALERSRTEGLRRRSEQVAERARSLADQQERIRRQSEEMLGAEPGQEREERTERVQESKERQAEEVRSLRQDLRRLSQEAGSEEAEAARRLREAAQDMDERQLERKIDFSRQITRGGAPDQYIRQLEDQIQEDLEDVSERLDDIGQSFRGPERDPAEDALSEARDLARGLESMRERVREVRERASGNPQGDGGFSPGARRQARSEAGQRRADAEALRDRLRAEGMGTEELDRIMRGLDRLADERLYENPEELERLQSALADQAKRMELMLRVRLMGEERARLFLSGADAVPPEYREMVEAYYRSLSRENGGR